MAQQAGRSSVELYTNLFFKGKTIEEPGYVTQILQNGFGVLIPSYGIEGVVYTTNKEDSEAMVAALEYVQESHTLVSPDQSSSIGLFQRVRVVLQVDDKPVSANVSSMRRKLLLRLTEPQIEGLSVSPEDLNKMRDAAAANNAKKNQMSEEKIVEMVTKHPEQVKTI
ncbi:exosome catalytic subunit dis3 [Kickxella alabastrina]|uniref:Exosome catalytic subunit dis3 n=1 Tax=Kickxella alabastrina TaxID=61397 RepID=A0ACC1I2R9_9FUNG|nr:exosome catalytic subunit dis3 [Kickxella alabastrina]